MTALGQFTTKPANRRQILILAFVAFIVVFLLWQFAGSSVVLYPFRLFVTFVHELGHGLTAVVTGGSFEQFTVYENGAGVTTTRGGSPFLVPQMGYLGAALFGAILLFAANRVQRVNWVAAALGIFFAGCSIWFTGTGKLALAVGIVGAGGLWLLADRLKNWTRILRALSVLAMILTLVLVRSEVALMVGILSGALLVALGAFASRPVIVFVLNVLAFITGFNAVSDIWSLMGNQTASLGRTPNDALAMANYTHIPTAFWIILWTGLAIVMMGISTYLALIRSGRSEQR